MLDIRTFDARSGGNVLYKAFAHPVAAERLAELGRAFAGGLAVYDPDGVADALFALNPGLPHPDAVLVHDTEAVGTPRAGCIAAALTDLPGRPERTLLVAAFEAHRIVPRLRHLLPAGMRIATLDEARLPERLLTAPRRYLDRLNWATNFAFFRDADGLSTRLVTANYWSRYGAADVRLWLRLFAGDGAVLAEWEEQVPAGDTGIAIDSREVRARFGLGAFAGQLFIHAIGVAGHDVVKYALDTMSSDARRAGDSDARRAGDSDARRAGDSDARRAGDSDARRAGGAGNEHSLSVTHDANAWPSDRYAGLPAPDAGERVTLWLQNSHAAPIPAGAVSLDRMGAEAPVPFDREVAPFASVAIDVASLLPGLSWPSQIEVRAGRHVVRPRYEVRRFGRTRIAHMNVERADLRPDPNIPELAPALGRGYLLPFPILPPGRFRTTVQPTPMAETQSTLPLRLDVFAADGRQVGGRFLGRLPRLFDLAVTLDAWADAVGPEGGHAELAYDFREGGEADGWLHALVRFEDRESGHVAETSFGAHIFNTVMTYRGEPQSYSGPPPGLSTRLFLKLGEGGRRSFAALIYPASNTWHPESETVLQLHAGDGTVLAHSELAIACSGSHLVFPDAHFASGLLAQAGSAGYVLIRDATCRLFGYHGQMDAAGGFSLDHMFGF